jgi:hypothetical protein
LKEAINSLNLLQSNLLDENENLKAELKYLKQKKNKME